MNQEGSKRVGVARGPSSAWGQIVVTSHPAAHHAVGTLSASWMSRLAGWANVGFALISSDSQERSAISGAEPITPKSPAATESIRQG